MKPSRQKLWSEDPSFSTSIIDRHHWHWPYAVIKNNQGFWTFELPCLLTFDVLDSTVATEDASEKIRSYCGIEESTNLYGNIRYLNPQIQANTEAVSHNPSSVDTMKEKYPDSIAGEKLQSDHYGIESDEKYRERISKRIRCLKEATEGSEHFLYLPSLPENEKVKRIFTEVMNEHGYRLLRNSENHVVWATQESEQPKHRPLLALSEHQLTPLFNTEQHRWFSVYFVQREKKGKAAITYYVTLNSLQANDNINEYIASLESFKKNLNLYAKKVASDVIITIYNNSNLQAPLTRQQANLLRKAGFILKQAKDSNEQKESVKWCIPSTVNYKIYFSAEDKKIKEVYDKLKEITETYIKTHHKPKPEESDEEEKDDMQDKQDMMQQLLDALTNGNDPDLQMRIHHFEEKLTKLLENSNQMNTINQHRSYTFSRYIGNVFSVLALLVPLAIRIKRNYEQYGLYQVWKSEFWQPKSAQVFYCAQNELKKLKPK